MAFSLSWLAGSPARRGTKAVQEDQISTPHKQARQADPALYDPISWDPSLDFVRYMIWSILIGTSLFALAILVFYPEMKWRLTGPVPMALVALVGWFQLRRGRPQEAIVAVAVGMWATISVVVFFNGGMLAPAYYIFPLLIMLVGWLLNARAALGAATLTSLLTVFFVISAQMGWLPPAVLAPPVLNGIVQVCVFFISALLVNSLVRAYQKQLAQLNTVNLEHAQHTQELELVKAELHQAQAVARVGSWVYDLGSDTMRLSDETCRIFGLPAGTTGSYQSYLERTHPEDRESLQQAWRAALQGRAVFDHEHRILVGPSQRWVRQKAQMEWTGDGAARRAVGITQDITEYKQIELGLRQSEHKFTIAFTSCPLSASIATAEEGRFIEVNDNYERDFGWRKDELLGHTTLEIGLWAEPRLRQQWVDALQKSGRLVDHETVWRHKSGERRHVSISGELVEIEGIPCVLAYVTDITERKAADEQIQSLAFFDPLTGLPNRRLLMDRLEQALVSAWRHQRLGALLFVDLDNFKAINDTYGHDKGDLLLKQVGARLSDCVREGDTVARIGGDEFVVMLEDLSGDPMEAATEAETVARKLQEALNGHYPIAQLSFHSTPSMGITLFGNSSEPIEEPLKRADLAMYQAKAAGRNTVRFFDPRMQAMVAARAAMERDLRQALASDQLMLHYQPQVGRGGLVTGAEVLLRWQHPAHGLIPSADFIPLAEECGLILSIGERVLETACRQLAQWRDTPGMAHLSLSVNVSPRQFQQDHFARQVLDVLQRTGAPPQRLTLELTEGLLIADIDDVIAKMDALKARGVGFALDDFGTGYSSLSHLKRLPLDQLKIDQGFVRDVLVDPNDAAISRMVIVLAESLGLEVIAEGVETLAQQQALQAQGCHAYQGYLYSPPLPIEDFAQLAERPDWPIMPARG